MKRFHVHVSVTDLDQSIAFYSSLFGQAPDKRRADYARWMLDDPGLNFAISSRGGGSGINHLGLQVDSGDELTLLKIRAAEAASGEPLQESGVQCCYAVSDKYWAVDPQGIAWEQFQTLGDADAFESAEAASQAPCCVPLLSERSDAEQPCCLPGETRGSAGSCCG